MAEYEGKKVKLDDPFRLPQGSDKKFGVYVKNPKSGNVIMVKYGDPNMSIKRDDPERLKNFRARHNCDQKTDKTTPGYWSCKFWEKGSPVSKLLKQGKVSESDLKFKGKEMKDHLDKAKAKLKAEYGSLDNVDYKKAMKVVGATLAARLSARGMIKRSDGSTKKGKLGKSEEEILNCGCGCEDCKSLEESINEETREFVKGWVNPRTKKIIAWRHHTPYHATHIYENLSKYGLTVDDLIDHHIAVLSKRNPKYKPEREDLEKRFEKIGYNDMLADRDETIEYPAIKKGWVAFVLQETKYGKMMTLRGIKKDIKKSGIMVLEKFKTFKDLDRILITNYKNTKFAEYTGKTKNEDERYTSNSEAMKFLFGRRPKRREPKTEIGRTMAMFREFCEAVKTRIDTDQEVLVVQDKDGNPNIFKDLESAKKKAESIKGKVIKGTGGELMVQVLVDPSLRKHLEEKDQWKDKSDEREHDKLFMKSLKVMPKSPKQKKIIQQMNALRKKNGLELLDEAKRIPKTRKNQDPDTHSDLYTDEDPRGTIHGLGFKDVKTAEASVRKIKASDRTHAHKIQAAIAMEQRAKVMKKTAEAAVYRKYIEQMKKKTKEMQEERKAPRDKGSGLPKKYVSGLSDKEAKQKAKEIEKRMKLPKDHPDAYKPVDDVEDPSIIDKKKSQQKSKATAKFQKAFGESFKEYIEEKKIKGIENKAKKTGVSYGILKQVYDRGMAAWRTGHRPGIPQQQWAYARINSFLTGGKTQKTTDKDLWAKVPAGVKSGIKAKLKEDVNEVYKDSGLGDWFGKGGGGGKESGGWDRYNTAGERIGKCGDAKKGAAYSACLSAEKAKQLGKAKIADFVKRKRDAQKKAGDKAKGGESKKGQKPVMVKTGAKGLDKKKNESYISFKDYITERENEPNNPALWKKAIAKAKQKFDVYPSAYANAWASKWYKSKGGTWSKKK